ncbi:MAG: Gfo/Idh/MocA family protein [Vicinamibacteria bacterium]
METNDDATADVRSLAGRLGGPAVLIGAGRMGRSHGQALLRQGLAVGAVCDTNADNLAQAGDELSVSRAHRYSDSERLFQEIAGPGLVVVATTADGHCDLVCRAAEAGARLVLCEKPMAPSVRECDRMLEVCESRGTRLAINHQMRFMPQYALVKEELCSGRFGRLASMGVVAGCFGVAMNGSHYVEAFRYLSESRLRTATAWFSPEQLRSPRGPQFRDAAGELRFVAEDGSRLNLEIGADQGHGMTVTYATTWGHILVDELAGEYTATARKPEHREQPLTRYGLPADRWRRSFPPPDNVGPTAAVQEALITGSDYPDGRVGRTVVAALAAAYRSAAEGSREVALDDLGEFAQRRFPWA